MIVINKDYYYSEVAGLQVLTADVSIRGVPKY